MNEDLAPPRPNDAEQMISGTDDVHRRLVEFEARERVFDEAVQGYPFWQTIRLQVARELLQNLGIQERALDPAPREGALRRIGKILSIPRLSVTDNPLRTDRRDVVVLGHPRRKLEDDGTWWDLYCDPWLSDLDPSWVYLERSFPGGRKRPAKTPHLFTLELPEIVSDLKRRLGRTGTVRMTPEEISRLQGLDDRVSQEFGVPAGVRGLVEKRLARRNTYLPIYRRILSRIRPRLALVVVSYFNHDFIEVCKDLGIPVAELQHGYIGPDHLGYSFPHQVHPKVRALFPDYFLAFGDYWKDRADFPIPHDRIKTAGYPYFDMKKRQYPVNNRRPQIVFLSQAILGKRLSKIAVDLSQRDDIADHNVVYKLHPGEYRRWKRDYPWLVGSRVEVIEADRPHLYQLFAGSTVQVGSFSTALFEGLGFSLATFLYQPGCPEGTRDLVDRGFASYFVSVEELAELVKDVEAIDEGPRVDSGRFFAQSGKKRFVESVSEILDQAGGTYT